MSKQNMDGFTEVLNTRRIKRFKEDKQQHQQQPTPKFKLLINNIININKNEIKSLLMSGKCKCQTQTQTQVQSEESDLVNNLPRPRIVPLNRDDWVFMSCEKLFDCQLWKYNNVVQQAKQSAKNLGKTFNMEEFANQRIEEIIKEVQEFA